MIEAAAPDAVVHLAAIPHPEDHAGSRVFANNVESAYNVFDAAGAADPVDARVDPDELTDYQREAWTAAAEFAEVRPIPVALADVYDVLGVTTTVAARHRAGAEDGDRLFGNVSTGPRIAADGVALACMIVGARPYSVEPERHRHDRREE
ncbi:hypothetical protein D3D02_19195, partial [Halobellus sp. Atlit-38R]